MLGLALSMLLSSLATSITNVALPTLTGAFGASFAAAQWVVLAYLLTLTSLLVGVGRLGDLLGRRRLLLGGLLLFTAASALGGIAPTLAVVIGARVLQGLGAAAMVAHTVALVGANVPAARTGRAMGLLGTMSAAGTALGPSLGGVLIGWSGWPAVFLVNVPLGLLAMALVARLRPDPRVARRPTRADFDLVGTALLAVFLGTGSLAFTGVGGAAHVLAAVALAAGLLLVRVEARSSTPLLPPAMLRARPLGPGLVMSLLVTAVVMATLVVGPFFLARGLGLDPAMVGAVMSVGPLVAALAGIPAGRAVDRVGANAMSTLGLLAMAAGAVGLASVATARSLPGYVMALGVLTAGYATFQAANNTAVMAGAPGERRGVTSALLGLFRNLGLVAGVAVMGAVFAAAAGGSDPTAAAPAIVAQATQATFAVASGLVALALLIGWGSRRRRADAALRITRCTAR